MKFPYYVVAIHHNNDRDHPVINGFAYGRHRDTPGLSWLQFRVTPGGSGGVRYVQIDFDDRGDFHRWVGCEYGHVYKVLPYPGS